MAVDNDEAVVGLVEQERLANPAEVRLALLIERDAGPRFERGRLGEAAGPSDGRTTFLTSRLVRAADGVLEAFPTERQGSHMTGALGESDGFAVAVAAPVARSSAIPATAKKHLRPDPTETLERRTAAPLAQARPARLVP